MAGAQGEAWLSRVHDAASGLPAAERADFKHLAYLGGAKAVLHSLESEDPGALYPKIELAAGFDKPDDPASYFWLVQKAPLEDLAQLPLPITASGRRSFLAKARSQMLPSFTIRKKELGADSSPFPQVVTLHDTPTPETRAINRSEADLNTFGYNVQILARALAIVLPEPVQQTTLVLIES